MNGTFSTSESWLPVCVVVLMKKTDIVSCGPLYISALWALHKYPPGSVSQQHTVVGLSRIVHLLLVLDLSSQAITSFHVTLSFPTFWITSVTGRLDLTPRDFSTQSSIYSP